MRIAQDFTSATNKLAGNEKRNKCLGYSEKIVGSFNEVVFMRTERMTGSISIIFENIDVTTASRAGKILFSTDSETIHLFIAGTNIGQQLVNGVAFTGGVFRMRSHI